MGLFTFTVLVMFSKAKSGNRITFHGTAACPVCHHYLKLKWVVQDNWPYSHGDFCLVCPVCNWEGVFGVPCNPLFGMELIIWDSDPHAVLGQAVKLEAPICPFHTIKMELTKIWGDMVMEDPAFIRVQWKCPKWFLVEHRMVQRETVSKYQGEKKQVAEKLKQLGYM